ncbi:hypothetical protein PSCICM_19020 [Pseudomonas cichorii]|uniref:Uncharacterized protein n=1 Tax=Pseudomonas cichorii TaxID=36746 RepID=A0ABQ1DNL5_PSECI|nr:hypothetical protein PSCICM_19020 [Pseudomonas cichorii]GFM92593.1 hypothetical protein PSCICP_25650 [Pseudomonas cichorii]
MRWLTFKMQRNTYAIKGFGYLERIDNTSGEQGKKPKTTNKWLFLRQINRKDIFLTLRYDD